ncbi:MAG: rhomboid family intramembrane serine protease [Bacteriovoracaceae bacterium]
MLELKKTYLSKTRYSDSIIVTLSVLAISLLFSHIYWFNHFDLSSYLAANKELVFKHAQFQRLFFSVLIHSDLSHLLSNSFMLSIFGILIHRYFGSWLFPLLTYLASVVSHCLSLLTYPDDKIYLVGASGWVFLLGGCWLCLYVCIEKKERILKRLFKTVGVGLVLFSPQSFLPEVSYRTHAIGFFVGIILGLSYYLIRKRYIDSFLIYEEVIEEEDDDIPYELE